MDEEELNDSFSELSVHDEELQFLFSSSPAKVPRNDLSKSDSGVLVSNDSGDFSRPDSDYNRDSGDSDSTKNRNSGDSDSTGNLDGGTQESVDFLTQTTLSQSELVEPQFKRLAMMSKYFKKRRLANGNVQSICQRCFVVLKAKEYIRLGNHLKRCSCISRDEKREIERQLEAHQETSDFSKYLEVNLRWSEVIVENNFSFNSIESKLFKEFMRMYVPKWKLPDRRSLSTIYIPQLSKDIENRFFKKIRDCGEQYLSVEFDHWRDANHRVLLGVIVSYGETGSRFLLAAADKSIDGKSTAVIVEDLVKCLDKLDPSKINSMISDSASECKAAREGIVTVEKFSHIIQHRCLAHLVNRIGDMITKNKDSCLKTVIDESRKLARIVANSPKIIAKIRDSGIRRVVSPCPVRWYSQVEMLNSLIEARTVIVEELSTSTNEDHKNSVIVEEFWTKMLQALKLLDPLVKSIAFIERSKCSLGEATKIIILLGKRLFELDWDEPCNFCAIKAYLTYICQNKLNNDEFGLLLAAYAIDPRSLLNFLTEDTIDLVLEILVKIALKSGCNMDTIKKLLLPEFEEYILGIETFSTVTVNSASEWWTERRDSGALRSIALRLANLKASSANIERTFSTLKYIQGSNRLNLSLELFIDIGRVKLSLNNENSPKEINQPETSTSYTPNCRPELLNQGLLRNYQQFVKYIDFSKVNKSRPISSQQQQPVQPESISELLELSRRSRLLKKNAML